MPVLDLIMPDWPAPANVFALSTGREGGVSRGGFASLNLGDHVGDDEEAVARNRSRLMAALPAGTRVQWLAQAHGNRVVLAGEGEAPPVADASWSGRPGQACAVLTADCLPVLLCSRDGALVAAAHAGWRGLAAGILETTVAALPAPPGTLLAWLGPAIGPAAFEVGPEVRDALAAAGTGQDVEGCFRPSPGRPGHFLADLYGLARLQLAALGVGAVYGGDFCTLSEKQRFYSYRRDGPGCGRMASLILRRPGRRG